MQTTSSLCPHSENNAIEYCGYFMFIKYFKLYFMFYHVSSWARCTWYSLNAISVSCALHKKLWKENL